MRRTLMAALAATVALPVLTTGAAAQQAPYTPREFPNPPHTPDRYITDWDEVGPNRSNAPVRPGQYPNPPYTPERYVTRWGDDRDRGTGVRRYGRQDREDGRAIYGPAPFADDRWAQRPHYEREFDRPSPPPGYGAEQAFQEGYRQGYDVGSRYADGPFGGADRGSYHRGYRDEQGFDPYSGRRWAREHERAEMAGDGRDMHAETGAGMFRGGDMQEMGARMEHMRAMHEMMHGRAQGRGYENRDFRRDFREDGRRGYYQDPTYEEMPYSGPGERARRMGMRPGVEAMRHAMRMIDMFDVDKDGRVTQEEVDRFRADRLRQFDADEDEALNREEYEQLWVDAMRSDLGERFDDYDADDDDRISVEEFSARTGDLVRREDWDRDAALTARDFGFEERPTEDYTGRPEVEAPLEPGEDHVVREGERQSTEGGTAAAEDGATATDEGEEDAGDTTD